MPHSVTKAIEAFKAGELLVVTDDDDREGEGDLIIAASLCTPEKMAFIVRHTSGIVCAPLTGEDARRLNLDPMVAMNDAPHATAFTVSVDYKPGLTTGISAEERTSTARGLANSNAGAKDFVRPGHIFPLIAREGGVLMRSGHTEAAVDLCKLAGLPPVGVICELVNDDGTVMKGEQVYAFAQQHQLKHVTIADLIAYRQAREKLVDCVAEFPVQTAIGDVKGYAFVTHFDEVQHFALVYGDISAGKDIPARLHRGSVIGDVFGGGRAIQASLDYFRTHGCGVLVYMRDGAAGVPNRALSPETHATEVSRERQWREIGLGAQILRELHISSIRNLVSKNSSGHHAFIGLSGFGIEISGTDTIDG